MKRIAILGPGLLGGSIALRLRELGGHHVALWARREEAVTEIQARECADEASTDILAVVNGAELVVLCVPVSAMPDLARQLIGVLRPETIVTDVGSVKATVVAELSAIFAGRARFVGSHPMAGTEFTGLAAAKADLFSGAACIVTPDATGDDDAVVSVSAFWSHLGCRVVQLAPQEHDECVALVSHLPHLVAGTLVRTVAAQNPRAFAVVGPGFRDSTRVASGPPEMWVGILRENAEAACAALDAMIAKLRDLRQTLAPFSESGVRAALAEAKQTRDQITFPK
jgi:prephenate dehydrogenase